MRIRNDFVTNSSSSSFITIIATKIDGTVITDKLEADGICEEQIFFSDGIGEIVNAETKDGEEILRNIQGMYCNPSIDYQLDESDEELALRRIKDLKELLKIEIKEEIFGDVMDFIECVDADGEFVCAELAEVSVTYNIENNSYSEQRYSALADGVEVEVNL